MEDNTIKNYLSDFYNAITEAQRKEIRKMFVKKVADYEEKNNWYKDWWKNN